ncbi:MAG: glycerophosphodiester phosphodiesterase family protein [Microbacterium gubbeenense]
MAVHPYLVGAPVPRILAHRGLVTNAMRDEGIAENTIAAFAAAHAAGATFIESDCHLTSDGEVVLFHDDRLDRVAGVPQAIADVTLAELESVMSTRGGLSTLAQALTASPDSRYNIDVKADGAAE